MDEKTPRKRARREGNESESERRGHATIAVRLPDWILALVDGERDRMREASMGAVSITRSDALRLIVVRLLAPHGKPTAGSAPTVPTPIVSDTPAIESDAPSESAPMPDATPAPSLQDTLQLVPLKATTREELRASQEPLRQRYLRAYEATKNSAKGSRIGSQYGAKHCAGVDGCSEPTIRRWMDGRALLTDPARVAIDRMLTELGY